MTKYKLNVIAVTVSLLAGVGIASTAMATSTGTQTLALAASSVDVYTFSCPSGTGPRVRVNDLVTPNPTGVSVQAVIGQSSVPTQQVTDTTDDGLPSAWTSIIALAGPHVVVFKKTGAGVESYNADVQCCTSAACGNPSSQLLPRQINQ